MVKGITLLDACVQAGVRYFVFSSLAFEGALRWYGEAFGLKYASLRYFNAAGADPAGDIGEDHDPETHLIPLVLKAASGKLPGISEGKRGQATFLFL